MFGAAAHLLFGGDIRRLAIFLLAGWIGFAVGHFVGVFLGIDVFNIGTLRVVSASVGALIALFAVQMLTAGQSRRSR